jgi:hypothetical protein
LTDIGRAVHAPNRILLTIHHKRRTSTCFGSFRAPGHETLEELVEQLPEPSAVDGLRQLGFTTLVLNKRARGFVFLFERKIRASGTGRLPLLLEDERLAAFGLLEN